jgi:hypothetical protein
MPSVEDAESHVETIRPLDIITGRSWDHALFTTYALSLSFYETQIHKLGLARNGCRDIRIVTDADGYQLSLSERQSHRVGNEYRLTPVALPNGVFHPKLTWLVGKDIDLVLIGSGNLTFGGFGKNVECLDLIRSDKHPGSFTQLRGLFDSWLAREDLQFAERDWLGFWRDRASRISAGAEPTQASDPELLHSSDKSIGQQLAERVTRFGEVLEVRSLSPFYDPDGAGILAFAESIRSPKLTIGLLPGREEVSTFPFHKHRQTKVEVGAALFPSPEDKRTLHAKVIEILMSDGSTLLVTGSVNATRKSLLTTDNIETAILRHQPDSKKSPFKWQRAKIPTSFRTSEFRKAGLGNRVLVSGRLTGDGLIRGKLITNKDSDGDWSATLQRIDGVQTTFDLSVDQSGEFARPLLELELFQHSAGLQLNVSRSDGRQGCGWVSVEGLLMAARRGFISPTTLMKLLGSESDEGDETELLRYLATSAQRHLPAFATPGRSIRRGDQKGRDELGKGNSAVQMPVEMLVSHEHFAKPESPDGKDQSGEAMLNTLMHRIRINLLRMQQGNVGTQDVDESSNDKDSEREQKERDRNRKQLAISLRDFQDNLQELAGSLAPGTERASALCMWLEVAFPILLRRLDEADEVELLLKQWLTKCLPAQTYLNSPDVLTGHVLSSLLTLASMTIERERESPATRRTLGRLHEQMETFCGESQPVELCSDLALLDSEEPPLTAELLRVLPTAPTLSEALVAILETPTPRQQLGSIVDAGANGSDDPSDLPILGLPAGQQFRKLVAAGKVPVLKHLPSSGESCPHCYLKLLHATLIEIRANRFGACGNCNGFLLANL